MTTAYSDELWRESAPKHVLMVSGPCCTRVQKQAHALRLKGWRVDCLAWNAPQDRDAFDVHVQAQTKRFRQFIESSGASIIHVHNEPDVLMREASIGANGRPIVYDCHDLEYYRLGYISDDERFAFERADAIINVSDAHGAIAYDLHPWDVPSAVVYSTPVRHVIPPLPSYRHGVVYEGGVLPPDSDCDWRNLTVPCQAFEAAGIGFDIYTRPDMAKHYPRVRGHLPYRALLSALTVYDFGFLGSDPPASKFDVALPNKLWEYAACGVIPLIVNAPEAARVFGGGIVATSTLDAIEQMRSCDIEALRADTLARARFMDDEIVKTIALYERF